MLVAVAIRTTSIISLKRSTSNQGMGGKPNTPSDAISLQIGGDLALFSKRNQRDGSRSSAFQACAYRFYRDAV